MHKTIPHHLIEGVRCNDRQAQLELYRKYSEGMFRVANRFVNNVQDAEDLMQEAFISAFQKIEQYSGEVAFGAWLKKIVINKCLDHLKSQKRQLELVEEHIPEISEEPTDWEVEEQVSVDEVKKAAFSLPEKYKRVILLYLFEGYSHDEIAQILDISVIASRSQLLRGKQKLKRLLKHQLNGSGY